MKKLMIFAISAAALGVMSCQKSEIYRPEEGALGKPNETPVQVSLATESLRTPVAAETVGTKTNASGDEAISISFGGEDVEVVDTKVSADLPKAQDSKITDIWAIQYDANGNLLGTPYYTEVTDAGTAGSGTTDWSYDLSVNLTTAPAGGKVFFVANTHSPSTFTTANAATVADLLKLTKHVGGASSEWQFNATSTIPMIGVYNGPVNGTTKITGVKLTRLFAKIILKYKVTGANIEINNVALKNVPTTYTYDTLAPRSATTVFPTKVTTSGSESHKDYPAVGKTALDALTADADGFKTLVWYMPENYRGQNPGVTTDADRILTATDGMGTYVNLSGYLKSPAECALLNYTVMLGNPGADRGNFNVERNSVYTVKVTIVGHNTADHRITKETFDRSNCGIIAPNSGENGQHTFDIRKLTEGWKTSMPTLGASAALRAEVLWQDRQNVLTNADISLDKENGLLTVKSTHNVSGNAVVALYDNATSGGSILWSWHIWVTSYNPNPTLGTDGHPYPAGQNVAFNTTGGKVHRYGTKFQQTNGDKVIMDRNLGAVNTYYAAPAPSETALNLQNTFGMFYQWGRKDPLPYVDASTINASNATGTTIKIYGNTGTNELAEATGPNLNAAGYKRFDINGGTVTIAADKWSKNSTLAYSVKNPLTFIYNAQTPYDWYAKDADNQNNDLWGDGSVKSPYDPCPKGWRVAPNGTWSDFTRDAEVPLNGTFPYYSDGVAGEKYGAGNYKATNGR
uniref:DUF4906 domain-containing protein n=1 Tax=uncultured Rikenella sp. TaxID=368003 RepID=UPI0025CC0D67